MLRRIVPLLFLLLTVFAGDETSAEDSPRIWMTPTNDELGKLTIHWQTSDPRTESKLRFSKVGDAMQKVPVRKEQGIFLGEVDISEWDTDWQFQIGD